MERPKATKRLTKLRRRIADRMYPVKQIYLPARMYYNPKKRMSQLPFRTKLHYPACFNISRRNITLLKFLNNDVLTFEELVVKKHTFP